MRRGWAGGWGVGGGCGETDREKGGKGGLLEESLSQQRERWGMGSPKGCSEHVRRVAIVPPLVHVKVIIRRSATNTSQDRWRHMQEEALFSSEGHGNCFHGESKVGARISEAAGIQGPVCGTKETSDTGSGGGNR